MIKQRVLTLLLPLAVLLMVSCGTAPLPTSDNPSIQLNAFFDLRDRHSFIQVTNVTPGGITLHVQVFDVGSNCNENNFYDTLTGNDTHVYNMSDVKTNNGNPSGVELPDDAYGFVVISIVEGQLGPIVTIDDEEFVMGNFRIIDNSGYEYRTNMAGYNTSEPFRFGLGSTLTFDFNQFGGANLSDVVGIALQQSGPGCNEPLEPDVCEGQSPFTEVTAANILDVNITFDVDIIDNNENEFSCRDVMFACVNEDSTRYEELLEFAAQSAVPVNVAGFEYGINEAFPHSKGSPLLCPSNNITEGSVRLTVEDLFGELPFDDDRDFSRLLDGDEFFSAFIGLNNGNGRGSMDSIWYPSFGDPNITFPDDCTFQIPERFLD